VNFLLQIITIAYGNARVFFT